MCRFLYISLIVSLSCVTSQWVFADTEKRTPIVEFRGTSQFHLLTCQIRAKTALIEVELGKIMEPYSPISACIKEGRDALKKLFPRANATVTKNPAASKLLKDYYAAWLSAIDGISPEATERKITYENWQGEAVRKTDEIWNRFEIEAGL
jgi:hypothetical protein